MWQLLLHVNFISVTLTLVSFFLAALILAFLKIREHRYFSDFFKVAVFLSVPAYLYILVEPTGGWGEVGRHGANVNVIPWSPLSEGAGPNLFWETIALNSIIFVPLGIFSFLAFSGWGFRFLVGPVLSLCVEVLQGLLGTGRQSDINDLLANSAGYFIGLAFVMVSLFALQELHEKKK
ncbi:VanZ family protein [Nocardiopsis valliformis]|uniref:VanZ family protein n=1 Tax=Nocardiopsis valliformis TaxID=239974 RepID=UPI0009FF4592|nr:VanZ family protein [Nocardiopsis valliformis]